MKRWLLIVPIGVLSLAAVSCSDSDACGAGLMSNAGTCVAAGGDSSAGSSGAGSSGDSSGAGAPANAGGSANNAGAPDVPGVAGSPSTGTAFGVVCAVNTDCTGVTNYCVQSPFDPAPYCTASDCDKDASVCPDSWTCFNVGQFSPGAPYVCAKPTN